MSKVLTFDDFQVEVRCLQVDRAAVGAQKNVRQDRNGIPAFHHAVNMGQGLEEVGPLEGRFHTLVPYS